MSTPLVLRIVALSVSVADKTGEIIRKILKTGDLRTVDKAAGTGQKKIFQDAQSLLPLFIFTYRQYKYVSLKELMCFQAAGVHQGAGSIDPQTEADRSCQHCIISSLQKQFPNVHIFGEEELDAEASFSADWTVTSMSDNVLKHADEMPEDLKSVVEEDVCIWVDPLDGTREFTEGLLDHVTVLIGIAVKGRAVAGVIYQPYYNYQAGAGPSATPGRTIWAVVGLGAFGTEAKSPPADKRIVVTTRSHMTQAVKEAIDACNPTEILRVGGAGHKVLLLVDGRAHAYVFTGQGCKKWDTCAPEAVLHAIGGRLTDVHGNFYTYEPTVKRSNTGGTLATALASEHKWYLERIGLRQGISQSLPA